MLVESYSLSDAKSFAILEDSFKRVQAWNTGEVEYQVQAYWISKNGNTRGALCKGYISFLFNNKYAKELDNIPDYTTLSFADICGIFENKTFAKTPETPYSIKAKYFSLNAHIVFGNRSLWSSGYSEDEEVKEIVDAWFNLPNLPERYKVYKIVKKAP